MLALRAIVMVFRAIFTTKAELMVENLALRQQLNVLRRKAGRPAVAREVRDLIRRMSRANPLWGTPRIHGELLKLGIDISQPTVARYMVRHRKPPSPTWRAFLNNHVKGLVAIDHYNVTTHPTAEWTGQQLREAFPWDTSRRYKIRDRDGIYGHDFRRCVRALGIKEVVTARRSPWQNPYVERVIRSIRRECTDHIIVFNENHLRRMMQSYLSYYHRSRTHLSLGKDTPEPRLVEPPEDGQVIEFTEIGGLHHRYARRAA